MLDQVKLWPCVASVAPQSTLPTLRKPPLLGNLLEFRRDRAALLRRVAHECGGVGAFHLGPRRVVIVSAAAPAREVLVEHAALFEKGPITTRVLKPILGNGLASCPNKDHARRRRTVAPAFSSSRVARSIELMVEEAERSIDSWPDGATLDLAEEMRHLALRIVGRALFSVNLLDEAAELGHAMLVAQEHAAARIDHLLPIPLSLPWPGHAHMRAALRTMNAMVARLICERRAGNTNGDGDLLDALLAARDDDGATLDDQQIRDELMTLFVAGHQTIANGLAWSLYELCRAAPLAQRLHDEVNAALRGKRASADDLAALEFPRRVLKEALRMYPPVHGLGRRSTAPVVIGGHALERDEIVLVSVWLLHRRADAFARPDTFDPDRFAHDREASLAPYSYLPFGAGPRSCLGGGFAEAQGQVVLATIAQRVSLELVDPRASVPLELQILLRPRGRVPVRVHRRQV